MTHLRTTRSRRSTPVAALALAGAFLLPASPAAGAAHVPAPPAQVSAPPSGEVEPSGSPTRTDVPYGSAALAGGTTGGGGGRVVTVTTPADLAAYAGAEGPWIIRVAGPLTGEPLGHDIDVTSDKSIVGVGETAGVVDGPLRLRPGTHNVIIRNLTLHDSSAEGDREGSAAEPAAIRTDGADHVWIDHNRFTGTGTGLDLRDGSRYLTVSRNRFENRHAAQGPGRTTGATDRLTFDHNWFADGRPAVADRLTGPQRDIGTDTVLRVPAEYATVQAAVDAVPAGNDGRITVRLAPGTYREHVRVGKNQPYVSLVGTGRRRSDTLVVFNTPQGELKPDGTTQGSTGSATVLVEGHDFTARNLTFSNDFDEAAVEISGEQALAVKTTGDRLTFENTGFLGNQDTLMTDTPALTQKARVYITGAYIEGDVDFLYGRATTVVENSVIKALSRGSDTNNGYITAASTWKENPYGILITRSRVISDAPADTFHLGRPWHPSGNPDAIGQVLIRETSLPAAVKASPWSDMSGFPWREARFSEYRTYGPGAAATTDRPQMSPADAALHEVGDYLAGEDGWAPHRRH
ncbi:pectinesterase family protein [Streptomyces sp. NPDC005576]|uniref:pectinesterase family protein n=1 Tax=Streptomyces sp. NPDC005576 TaxID=3364726 RepID=UPI0036AAEDAB